MINLGLYSLVSQGNLVLRGFSVEYYFIYLLIISMNCSFIPNHLSSHKLSISLEIWFILAFFHNCG